MHQPFKSNKKALSPEHRKELLGALKARFEKNTNHHRGLEWARVQAKLEANPEKLWSLNEMERLAANRMLWVMMKRRVNTFFVIVQRKVPKAAGVFAYDREALESRKEHKQKLALLILQLPWALSF